MKLPSVLLCWNVLWSIPTSSPATVSQYCVDPFDSCTRFRLNVTLCDDTGIEIPLPCSSWKPCTARYDAPKANPSLPRMTALPTCAAATVTGAVGVPERLRVMGRVVVYVPSATTIVSPGTACAAAACRAATDDTCTTRAGRLDARLGHARASGTARAATAAAPNAARRRQPREVGIRSTTPPVRQRTKTLAPTAVE